MSEDVKYACFTPLMSPTLIDENVDRWLLKSFKQDIYHRNKPLDGMNDESDDDNAFTTTSTVSKVCIESQRLLSDPVSCFV